MKKLQKLVLHKATIMTNPQMKHITGGRRAECSATCPGGAKVVIDNCSGMCSAQDGVGVICGNPQTSAYCKGYGGY
jgi:hypothetical protein